MPAPPRQLDSARFLRRAIRLAKRIERTIPTPKLQNHKIFLGLGFLVRNRRLAEAILALGTVHAYEAGILMRSMLEIQINYAWIRKGRGLSRARRFMRFEPIERLQITTDIQDIFEPEKAAAILRRFRSERSDARHLFRRRDRAGRAFWAGTWATVPALRDRFIEIYNAEGGTDRYPFMYGLYRIQSSAAHGGPLSLSQVIRTVGGRPRAVRQPESNPTAHMKAATATLITTSTRVARDAGIVRRLQPEIGRVVSILRADIASRDRLG